MATPSLKYELPVRQHTSKSIVFKNFNGNQNINQQSNSMAKAKKPKIRVLTRQPNGTILKSNVLPASSKNNANQIKFTQPLPTNVIQNRSAGNINVVGSVEVSHPNIVADVQHDVKQHTTGVNEALQEICNAVSTGAVKSDVRYIENEGFCSVTDIDCNKLDPHQKLRNIRVITKMIDERIPDNIHKLYPQNATDGIETARRTEMGPGNYYSCQARTNEPGCAAGLLAQRPLHSAYICTDGPGNLAASSGSCMYSCQYMECSNMMCGDNLTYKFLAQHQRYNSRKHHEYV